MHSADPDQLTHDAYQCFNAQDFDQAERICNEILQQYGEQFDALHCLGLVHFQRGQLDQAVIAFTQALQYRQDADLYSNLGLTLSKLGHIDEALACFDAAISLDSNNVSAFYNRGNLLQTQNQPEDALSSYHSAIAINPQYWPAWSNRGNLLRTMHRPDEALESYNQAIAINPHHPTLLNNRGVVLVELHRPAEALNDYANALALFPGYTEALYNQGNALLALGQTVAAKNSFDRAVESDPFNADAHFNRSLPLLLTGQLEEGWREYEWRWKQPSYKPLHQFDQPRWTGAESLRDKTILLHAEQGMGDTLQFVRYIPMVKALGARIILEVQAPLKTLLAELEYVDVLITQGDPIPAFDFHCMLMSLPYAFNTGLSSIPVYTFPITAPADQVNAWKARLEQVPQPRIGLVWSGNPDHKNDVHRSIPFAYLIAQLAPEFEYISVQQELREHDKAALNSAGNVLPVGEHLKDFADTAALVANLDLIISVDTSVAHLAGAMGKPVWIMLPYAPDWRWMETGESSPWYPSARLFRQPGINDWDTPIKQLNQSLRELFAGKPA